MNEEKLINECPICKSDNIEKKLERTSSSKTTWADGLGSPGIIFHDITIWLCKNCNHVWEIIK